MLPFHKVSCPITVTALSLSLLKTSYSFFFVIHSYSLLSCPSFFFFLSLVKQSSPSLNRTCYPFWLKGFIKNYSRLCQPTSTKMAFDFISVQMLTSVCGFFPFIGFDINIHTAILASVCFPFCTKQRIQQFCQ